MKYTVSVGNIGNIECSNLFEANKTYNDYVRQSKGKPCRAHREDVFLLGSDGEPIREFYYSSYKLERLETNVSLKEAEHQRARDILEEYKLEIGAI